MLLNISNHPSNDWPEVQICMAKRLYGQVVDISFPQIDPGDSTQSLLELAVEFAEICRKQLEYKDAEPHAVHVMGEHTFTYALVRQLQQRGISCIASTTQRNAKNLQNGGKVSHFAFYQFREYPMG